MVYCRRYGGVKQFVLTQKQNSLLRFMYHNGYVNWSSILLKEQQRFIDISVIILKSTHIFLRLYLRTRHIGIKNKGTLLFV